MNLPSMQPVPARGFLAPESIDHFDALLSLPSSPLRSRSLKVGPLKPSLRSGGALPQWVWPPSILVRFKDLETLLMTSKCAVFYAHNLSFHAYPCVNIAHRMFVYIVPQKLPRSFVAHSAAAMTTMNVA